MDTLHACIKNNTVVNIVVVDNQNIDIIDTLQEVFEYDLIIESIDPLTSVGWAYDSVTGSCINPEVEEELLEIIEPATEAPN